MRQMKACLMKWIMFIKNSIQLEESDVKYVRDMHNTFDNFFQKLNSKVIQQLKGAFSKIRNYSRKSQTLAKYVHQVERNATKRIQKCFQVWKQNHYRMNKVQSKRLQNELSNRILRQNLQILIKNFQKIHLFNLYKSFKRWQGKAVGPNSARQSSLMS